MGQNQTLTDSESPVPKAAVDSRSAKLLSIETLEAALKASTLAAGTLYVIGLIVTSLRLAQLGLLSTDFIKPIYVLTGAWALLPIAAAGTLAFVCREAAMLFDPKRFVNKMRIVFIATAMAIVISFVIYSSPSMANSLLGAMGFESHFAPVTLLLASQVFIWGWLTVHLTTNKGRRETSRLFFPATVAIWLMWATFYILSFTLLLYTGIPAQLGGGGTRYVALVVEDLNVRQAITGSRDSKAPILTPVLAETSTSFVVPAPNSKLEDYSLNPSPLSNRVWKAQSVFERSFVIVPKSAVVVATVIGSKPSTPTATPSPTSIPSPTPLLPPTLPAAAPASKPL